ncbi:MAG: DNA replication/repair protein RecF [Clostridiales bacterium]|nr:DNA replication/repair protein RecF [Clostridiales bacterium]
MNVKTIELDYFRNYTHLEAKFEPGVNVIYGENAQGKTNLLEAIAYLSAARSHRARFDKELIMFDINSAFIKSRVNARQRDFTIEATLNRGAGRKLSVNGVKLKSAADLSGVLTTVLFCPEDLSLIQEGAAARRRFLDDCLCQLRPKYAAALAEYKRLYEHKLRILRDADKKPALKYALNEFNFRMAQAGGVMIHYRALFIKRLSEYASSIHQDFSGGQEKLSLGYETVSTITDPEASLKDLFNQILDHQESVRQAELESRLCLSGPHKDDLVVELDGQSARQFASQGQTRTAALSLKLGAREIFFQDLQEYPVLLLDDVLSELDARRQEFVLQRIKGGQVFITCCENDRLEGLGGAATFRIHGGALVK